VPELRTHGAPRGEAPPRRRSKAPLSRLALGSPSRKALRPLAALAVAAVAVSAGSAAWLASATPAQATSAFAFTRVAGANRYATAADLAVAAFPGGAPTVLLATGQNFPDALAGSYLAGCDHAPILLTTPEPPVPPETLVALARLGARKVVILGGTAAVSSGVEGELAARGYQVSRLAGDTRFGTMQAIDEAPGTVVGTGPGGRPTAVLTTGTDFPDALSAGPLAFARHFPVVLSDGSSPVLPPKTLDVLLARRVGHVIVIGGSAAVSPLAVDEIEALGISVEREGGPDRLSTSTALAARELAAYGFSASGFVLARGDGFADALAAAPAAGLASEPLLLTDSPVSPGAVPGYAAQHAATLSAAVALGGPVALADGTLATIASAAGAPAILASGQPYPPGSTGYDISWPQCGEAYPAGPFTVAIVGVNDGHAFSTNPCLTSEAAWAGPHLSDYINLNAPEGSDTSQWANGPAGPCSATDELCQAYNYGANAAAASVATAGASGATSSVWWLDVETANYWTSDPEVNAEVIRGALDALAARHLLVAIYSTPYQWSQIAGSYSPPVAEWVPTGVATSNPARWCGAEYRFTSGPTWLVQRVAGNYDGDYAC
jgi:putative cell wall-binding protein